MPLTGQRNSIGLSSVDVPPQCKSVYRIQELSGAPCRAEMLSELTVTDAGSDGSLNGD